MRRIYKFLSWYRNYEWTDVLNLNQCLFWCFKYFLFIHLLQYYLLLIYACYPMWRSISHLIALSIQPCPRECFWVLSGRFSSLSCLLTIPDAVCYSAFCFSVSLHDSKFALASWYNLMIPIIYVLSASNVFS